MFRYLYGEEIKFVVLKKNEERCEIGKINDYSVFSLIDYFFKKMY